MDPIELVDRYFALAARDDVEAYVAQFRDDAVVVDDGRERHDLRAWRRDVPDVTHTVEDVRPREDGADADVLLAGDFPGSPVRLAFGFGFDADGRITALTIRPRVVTR
ncbi:MAG TPA: hypothetical protein VNP37_21205 [Actinomycetospora sp.]|jgi:hypothetical protein|nr:hypothetical protein [Actinomycetospora sp.]